MTSIFKVINFLDILDVVIVSYLFYRFFLLFRGTRAIQLVTGVGILIVTTFAVHFIQLQTISWILAKFWTIGVVAILIVFQPEVRRALTRMGQSPFLKPALLEKKFINALVQSVLELSRLRQGAIIVFERNTGLEEYIESGVRMDSEYSIEVIITIFTPTTPLHDGAVIVRHNAIIAAGCLLPLTDNPNLSRVYGTRHRAAIGLSEDSDALIIVVSEETGSISLAVSGKISSNLNGESLKEMLTLHGS